MNKTLLCIVVCVLLILPGEIAAKKKTLFLLAGQSNAQGLGGRGEKIICPENTCYEYNVILDSIIPLRDPVGQHWKTLNKSGGSICPAFAKTYYELSGGEVYMVTAARGGSSIHANSRLGAYNTWANTGDVFTDAVEKTQKAIELSGVSLTGVIWMQGERDANSILDGKLTAEQYEQGLEDVIRRFRAEFGRELPFYIVLIGYQRDKDPAGCQAVRDMQVRVARKVKRVYVAYSETDTFAERNWYLDHVHYCQEALNDIGRTVAREAFKHK